MSDLTTSQLDTLITNAYNALNSALTNPKASYTLGDKSIEYNEYIKTLTETLSSLRAMKGEDAYELTRDYHYDVKDDGTDDTEYLGDEE